MLAVDSFCRLVQPFVQSPVGHARRLGKLVVVPTAPIPFRNDGFAKHSAKDRGVSGGGQACCNFHDTLFYPWVDIISNYLY